MSLQPSYTAGFWRRSFAFIIDVVLVSLFCGLIVSIFSSFLHQHSVISTLLGYLCVVLYFGLLNSHLNLGKTFAKQLLKIKVLDLEGNDLSVSLSISRAAILFAPLCLISLSDYIENFMLSWGIKLLFICLQILIIYFYLFNGRNRRSIHDFISNSIVINVQQNYTNIKIPSIWKKHEAFAAILVIACMVFGINLALSQEKNDEIIQTQLKDIQPEIIHIQETSESITDRKLSYFDVRIKSPDKLNNPFFAQQFIENLQKANPSLMDGNSEILLILRTDLQFGLISTGKYNLYSVEQNDTGLNIVEQQSSEFNQISFLSINF
ncbi:RDD family protein [Acinetobacter sp. ABJ_C5_2]|uniref:RDD family protein n=1 Tax=Acinetobacter sp. ABJ_C5_2 TaxID=3376992 RepID=UPI0037C9456B